MPRSTILAIHRDPELAATLDRAIPDPCPPCQTVANGPEALALLERRGSDLVILDTEPVLHNFVWVLREIRRAYPALPVVVVTRPGQDEIKRAAFENGADSYLDRPVDAEVLRRLVSRLLPETVPGGVGIH